MRSHLMPASSASAWCRPEAPGWWNLVAVVCWWSAIKLVGHGLFAAVNLPIVRARENLARRSRYSRGKRTIGRSGASRVRSGPAERRRRQLTREVRDSLRADRDVLV